MRTATMLGTACLLALASASANSSAGNQPMNAVTEKIEVESRNGKVLLRLTFDNASERAVHVPKSVASEDELFGSWFEIRAAASGEPIAYIGPMAKRAPPGPDDYLVIKPHTKHRNTIDITNAYAFRPGRHTYRLSNAGHYVSDLRHVDQVAPLAVAPVQFTHTGK